MGNDLGEPDVAVASAKGTCYRCDRPGNTRDHVPPKVFFPKAKEVPGQRQSLVTVPSCRDHNMGRSDDDEYAFALLANCVSPVAPAFDRRALRALTRNNAALAKRLLSRSIPALTASGPTAGIQYEQERLFGVLRATAEGLLFDMDGKRTPSLTVFVEDGPFADSSDDGALSPYSPSEEMVRVRELLQRKAELRGANPRIFSYQARRWSRQAIVRMTFYREIVVWAAG